MTSNSKDHLKPVALLEQLTLPAQDRPKLSFAGTKASKVADWINGLKATQVNQTSVQLYRNLPELPRLKTDVVTRFDSLEACRPTVQHCNHGLSHAFLQKPLVLPEGAQKSAIVAQAIQKAMVDGYSVCIRDLCLQKKLKTTALDMLAKCLHRSITGIGLMFLRNYQIYTQTPPGLWRRLHMFYLIAEYHDLLDKPVMDPLLSFSKATSIQAAYLRVVMLASAKSNQLSQTDVSLCYQTFESWSQFIKTYPEMTDNRDNFLVIDLLNDTPPVYKSRLQEGHQEAVLELDFKLLLGQLSKQSGDATDIIGDSSTLKVPKDFPAPLLEHLLNTWGNIALRKQERKETQTLAEACVGLVDCHYFISGGQQFENFVGQEGDTSSVFGRVKEASSSGFTPLESKHSGNEFDRPVYKISLQNVSTGGYCVLWKGQVPSRLQAGEIIGIKEMGRRTWNIGVVRWIRLLKGASQLGIQLLSSQARPYALARTYDMGGYSEYMRALLLPPSKVADIPSSLVTAAIPFQEFDKVRSFDGDTVTNLKLDKCVFSTGSMQQFSFKALDGGSQVTKPTKSNTDDFDSAWE